MMYSNGIEIILYFTISALSISYYSISLAQCMEIGPLTSPGFFIQGDNGPQTEGLSIPDPSSFAVVYVRKGEKLIGSIASNLCCQPFLPARHTS